jgi:hypothetical protein
MTRPAPAGCTPDAASNGKEAGIAANIAKLPELLRKPSDAV